MREEGFFKLWHGMSPAIYRHLVYSGVRMTFYEYIRDDIIGKNDDGTIPLSTAVFGGVIAGSVAQFLASPADLVKVQIQMEGRRKLEGLPPRVTGVIDASRKVTTIIIVTVANQNFFDTLDHSARRSMGAVERMGTQCPKSGLCEPWWLNHLWHCETFST